MSSDAAAALIPQGVINALLRANGPDQKSLFSYIVQAQLDGRAAGSRRRRKWIMERIPLLPKAPVGFREDNTVNVNFWLYNLTEEERHDSEIVYKLLEYRHTKIFGNFPFTGGYNGRLGHDEFPLPDKFLHDVEALLAFVRGPSFHSSNWRVYNGIPEHFRDNFDAMKAVCARIPLCLQFASPRLRDDEELVRIAALPQYRYRNSSGDLRVYGAPMHAIKEASERLRSDEAFVADLLHKVASLYNHSERMNASGWARLQYVLPGPFSLTQMGAFLELVPSEDLFVPSEDYVSAIDFFPKEVLDDTETMLRLMNKQPSNSGVMFSHCSKRVQKDEEVVQFVTRSMGQSYMDDLFKHDIQTEAMRRVLEGIKAEHDYCYDKIPTGKRSSRIAANKVKCLAAIPLERRFDMDVMSTALYRGLFNDPDSVLAFIKDVTTAMPKVRPHTERESDLTWIDIFRFYSYYLPKHLKESEAVALAFIHQLKCSHQTGTAILQMVPRLKQSRDAVLGVLGSRRPDITDADEELEPDEYLSDCPSEFLDDRDFMLEAVRSNGSNLTFASERLRSDPDLMMAVVSYDATLIRHTSPEFQLNNLDIVAKAIELFPQFVYMIWRKRRFFQYLTPEVWTHRPLIMKWLNRSVHGEDRSILKLLKDIHPGSPFLNDKEVVSLSVQYNSSDFAYASEELKGDRDFVLQLLKMRDRIILRTERILGIELMETRDKVLQHAAPELRFDEEIATVSLARNIVNLVECFDILDLQRGQRDLQFLLELSLKIRLKLEIHDSFVWEFLRGMAAHDQHILHPSRRCLLPRLDRGLETSIDFKRQIAEYLGAPVGEEYARLKGASLALERFGLY